MDLFRLVQENPALAGSLCRLNSDPDTPFPVLVAKIKLTWRCNLRCRACTLWRLGEQRGEEGDALSTDPVIGIIAELARRGLKKIHFSGGEVLLRRDFKEILDAARHHDLQVNLTTNGTLLDDDWARFLIDRRIHTVSFSLDGHTRKLHDEARGHDGAWRMTRRGMAALLERRAIKGRGPRIGVNTVITRHNADTLSELYEFLVSSGVDMWRLLPVRTSDRKLLPNASQWKRLTESVPSWQPFLQNWLLSWDSDDHARLAAKGKYQGQTSGGAMCYAPWFSLFIDADGEVFPCCHGRMGMPSCGDITCRAPEQVMNSPTFRSIRAGMASGHVFRVCSACYEFLRENESLHRIVAAGERE